MFNKILKRHKKGQYSNNKIKKLLFWKCVSIGLAIALAIVLFLYCYSQTPIGNKLIISLIKI